MSVETVTYISDLDETLPPRTDPRREGSDHLRNIKKAIKATFPNVTGAASATAPQLNQVVSLGRTRSYFMGQA